MFTRAEGVSQTERVRSMSDVRESEGRKVDSPFPQRYARNTAHQMWDQQVSGIAASCTIDAEVPLEVGKKLPHSCQEEGG